METQKEFISPMLRDNKIPLSASESSVGFQQEYQQFIPFKNEPIDLTVSQNKSLPDNKRMDGVTFASFNNRRVETNCYNFESRIGAKPFPLTTLPEEDPIDQNQQVFYPRRKRSRNFSYTNDGKLVMVNEDCVQACPTFTQTKQLEILKAAKSLFSKRTRTLYHWMYPMAPKQEIKSTVMTSWDSLADSEKAFYISQVLGRFGISQTNLMVNPQLGVIKEPPRLTDRIATSTKTRELESAISSISPMQSFIPNRTNSMTFEEFEALNEMTRKKRGRPKGATQIKNKVRKVTTRDFQDDPELSQELEKFATKFNLNILY